MAIASKTLRMRYFVAFVFSYFAWNLEIEECKPFLLQFKMREPQKCNILCHWILDAKTAKDLKEKIDDEYRVNM